MKAKKVLTLGLCLALVMNFIMPSVSLAKSSSAGEDGINLKMTGGDSWEYIEKIDGETYKVVEKLIDIFTMLSKITNELV